MAYPGWSMVGIDLGCGSKKKKREEEEKHSAAPMPYPNLPPPPLGNYGSGPGYGYGNGYNNGPPPGPPAYQPVHQAHAPYAPAAYNGPPPPSFDEHYRNENTYVSGPNHGTRLPPPHVAPVPPQASRPGETPREVLRICKKYGGAQFTIDRVDAATGQTVPMWILHRNMDDNVVALLYADHHQQQRLGDCAAVSAKLHTWTSSSIDVTVRGGEQIQLKKNDMGTGHKFFSNGHKLKWVQDEWTLSKSKLYLKDEGGRTIGRYLRKPDGRLQPENPTFELLVPVNEMDMDLFIGTGVAVAAYWAKEKQTEIDVVSELFGAM